MKNKLHYRFLIPMVIIAVFLIVSISYGMYTSKAELMEQTETCLQCHDDKAESLAGSPHQLLSERDISSPVRVGCTGCHDNWEIHTEDPSTENISLGSELSSLKQAQVCARCHQTPHQAAMITTDPHSRNDMNCSSCHTIHSNTNNMLVNDDSQNFCTVCHTTVAMEFKSRSVHPLESGNIRCTDCHNLGGIKNHDMVRGLDWTCQECHSDIAGPHIYEHTVTYSYPVEGSGCAECHNPHGSPNDRLLKQPGSGTCNQCHTTPPGHRIAHAGLGSRFACIDCHSEVHGSNDNRLFLDPDLGAKGAMDCYLSGCHSLER